MKIKIVCLFLIVAFGLTITGCSQKGSNGIAMSSNITQYQKRNLAKFSKKKKTSRKNGSRYHPAVRPQDRGKK